MKMVLALILRQRMGDAVQNELAVRNTVRITSDKRAEISRPVYLSFQRFMAEHHVVKLALAIRNIDGGDYAAVVRNPYFHPLNIGQRE